MPVDLNEWIKMRIEFNGKTAEMFINDMKYSSFIVDEMLGVIKREEWDCTLTSEQLVISEI